MPLSDIATQARNKVEKHDHLTRANATALIERLTPEDHAVLAGEEDVEKFRAYLAACQLRLSEADAAKHRAALAGSGVAPQAITAPETPPAADTPPVTEPQTPAIDDTDVE